jgi:hypothetical protein
VPFIVINSLYVAALLVAILLLAYGWYIVRTDLPWKELVPGVLAAIVYVVFDIASKYLLTGWVQLAAAVPAIAVLAGYIKCIRRAVNSASSFIVAHMLVIQKSGIAPKTTPVYGKHLMMKRSLKAMVVFCVLLMVSLLGGVFLRSSVWPPMFIEGLVSATICAALAWMMSLKKEKIRNYYLLEDEDAEVSMFSLHEVENVNPESPELEAGGRPYEDGMALPRAPRIKIPAPEQPEATPPDAVL